MHFQTTTNYKKKHWQPIIFTPTYIIPTKSEQWVGLTADRGLRSGEGGGVARTGISFLFELEEKFIGLNFCLLAVISCGYCHQMHIFEKVILCQHHQPCNHSIKKMHFSATVQQKLSWKLLIISSFSSISILSIYGWFGNFDLQKEQLLVMILL